MRLLLLICFSLPWNKTRSEKNIQVFSAIVNKMAAVVNKIESEEYSEPDMQLHFFYKNPRLNFIQNLRIK